MKNKHYFLKLIGRALFFAAFGAIQILAQPSDAQLKKVLTSPRTVSVTLDGAGTFEWSKTYKKYTWTRDFTAKLKIETPGEFLIVKGYAAYDVIGERYAFRRTFTSSNESRARKIRPLRRSIRHRNPTVELKYRTRTLEKLLDRRILPESEVEKMAIMSKIPMLPN